MKVSPTSAVLTVRALIEFQKKNGINPAGYFGPATRA